MGRKCCLCGKSSGPKTSVYKLPTTPERRNDWIKILKLKPDIDERSKICSAHFKKSDITNKGLKKKTLPKRLFVEDKENCVTRFSDHLLALQKSFVPIRPKLKDIYNHSSSTNNGIVLQGNAMTHPDLPNQSSPVVIDKSSIM